MELLFALVKNRVQYPCIGEFGEEECLLDGQHFMLKDALPSAISRLDGMNSGTMKASTF